MRRCIVREFGDPDRVELELVDDPAPGQGEILIRVRAAALNRIDLSLRRGNLARAGLVAPAARYFLGWDVAGEVVDVGAGVRRFSVGDRVIGLRDVLGSPGTHADLVVLPEHAVAPAPRGLGFEQAAALPMAGLTAAGALRLSALRTADRLLVTGAAGEVGRMVVELAVMNGVRVIAAADERDREDLLARGAEHVLGREADLPRSVRELLPHGVDAVIDCALLGVRAHEALRGGGVFVALVAPFAPPPLRGTRVVVAEVSADGGTLTALSALAEAGYLTPRVAATYPLESAVEAHAVYEQGGHRGRILLVP